MTRLQKTLFQRLARAIRREAMHWDNAGLWTGFAIAVFGACWVLAHV